MIGYTGPIQCLRIYRSITLPGSATVFPISNVLFYRCAALHAPSEKFERSWKMNETYFPPILDNFGDGRLGLLDDVK